MHQTARVTKAAFNGSRADALKKTQEHDRKSNRFRASRFCTAVRRTVEPKGPYSDGRKRHQVQIFCKGKVIRTYPCFEDGAVIIDAHAAGEATCAPEIEVKPDVMVRFLTSQGFAVYHRPKGYDSERYSEEDARAQEAM
jgi:ribosomal protein S12